MLLALGQFPFLLLSAPLNEWQRQRAWKHATNSRVGARDASQYVGQGNDSITLAGLIAAGEIGSPLSLDVLVAMADTGDAYVLVDGTGRVHGAFVIAELHETQTYHNLLGVAQKIEFTLTLNRVDDSAMAATADSGKSTAAQGKGKGKGSLDAAPVPNAPAYVKPAKARAKKG